MLGLRAVSRDVDARGRLKPNPGYPGPGVIRAEGGRLRGDVKAQAKPVDLGHFALLCLGRPEHAEVTTIRPLSLRERKNDQAVRKRDGEDTVASGWRERNLYGHNRSDSASGIVD